RGLFLAQSVLGALVPAAVYVLARRLGARRLLSVAIAAIPVLDPVLARLAHSESYFSPIFVLLTLASLLCPVSADPRRHPFRFALAITSAGLLVAQAARIHPLAWAATTMVPIPLLVGPGSLRHRLRKALLSAVGITLVVVVASGGFLWSATHGPLAGQW